ncbi:unnamed protein product [Angiostrongylus costaricensis]|uniref:WD repeat-containing protein 44 n=1 Tax=Angiostrongylus costaricensis TaxID=334426 RepID=A0A0R3PG22_ANGCS|nr:unnamed protein product [Angiostrongylus costaricensis]
MSGDFDEFVDAIDFERPDECVAGSAQICLTSSMENLRIQPSSRPAIGTMDDVTCKSPVCEIKGSALCYTPSLDKEIQSSALFNTPAVCYWFLISRSGLAPHFQDSGSFSRRDRLTALRRRMREEFGAMDFAPTHGTATDCDSLSITSEATSMHSWHRRVIASTQTVVVHPSDSVSTRAGPANISNNSPHTQLQASTSDDLTREATGRRFYLALLWLRTLSSNLTDFFWFIKLSASPISNSAAVVPMSPTGPPPNHPPPPLPVRFFAVCTYTALREVSNDLRSPPPLPPRNPSIRLPVPIAAELIARLNLSEDTDRVSSTSNDSLLSSADARRRGHTKTNSLDRGLTLAKSLKTGPFPPPSNKSNSLTRQEVSDDGEECARNTAAEGVILQITTTLIGDQSSRSGDLEPIASESSSMSSPRSELSKKVKGIKARKVRKLAGQGLDEEVKVIGKEHVDPITRDVERRMSIKRDFPLHSESISDDIRSDRFSQSRSSIDYAKSWARSYSNFASGLFRGALQKMKTVAHSSASVKGDDTSDSEGDQSESGIPSTGHSGSIVRPRKGKKGPFDFEQLRVVQELCNEHTGAVWCVRFSVCGRLMATAGQDNMIRVWAARSHLKYFIQMRERYQHKNSGSCNSPGDVFQAAIHEMESFRPPSPSSSNTQSEQNSDDEDSTNLFSAKPFVVFKGHTADILDLSWSKNYFVLSSGMDRTVKLWHLSRNECLCCFQHVDFVTSVAFLPKDDRYFLSGSLDGKLRMWHIPDKKVAVWNEVPVKFITAIAFVKNGKFAVVGTYNGRCFFYSTDQLKYHTVVDVRSSRGKNSRGHKVTGLAVHGDKLLVTSNDSRIRMYDVRDKALTCKFRGAQNEHSQIRAAFSPDGRHIVCGSEDK